MSKNIYFPFKIYPHGNTLMSTCTYVSLSRPFFIRNAWKYYSEINIEQVLRPTTLFGTVKKNQTSKSIQLKGTFIQKRTTMITFIQIVGESKLRF